MVGTIENSLFYSDSTSKELVIEASLRSSSLLGLSQTINVDSNFIGDLKSIYKKTRFSVDIDSCILFRFVNGLWWEACTVVQGYKFNEQCTWEKVDKNQFDTIESLYQLRQDVSVYKNEKGEDTSAIGHFLSQGNVHFERFKTVHGGAVFKPSGNDSYSQYDHAFLKHVAAIISFCVDKETSSHYLNDVYQNIQEIADKLNLQSEKCNTTPAMYTCSETGLHSKLGFLRIIKHIVESRQLNSYIVVLSIDHTGDFVKLLDEEIVRVVLNKVTNRLKSIAPNNNTLSYIDTTDFAFIVVNSEESVVVNILSQIKSVFLSHFLVEEYRVHCEINAGYSCYSSSSPYQPEELLKMASIALFQAHNNRTNNIIGYDAGIVQELQLHLALCHSLSRAIDNNEFVIYFQPIVSISRMGKNIQNYEALIRWQHPERGLIPPDKFIAIAEKNGTIVQLGYWIIKRVCQYLSMPSVPKEVSISVNLSPVQLDETDLVERIINILNQYSIAPQRITVEITESSAMQDHDLAKEKFSEFNSAGFQLAMDDFGTGYSSLSYLLKFPFDILKIDRSFIDNTLIDQSYEVIGRTMVKLAHDLSLLVVCEGIETDEQLQMVKSWNTDMIQGYLISKPKPWLDFF